MSNNNDRLVSLGYSIQAHRYIKNTAQKALERLETYGKTEVALRDAKRIIKELLDHSEDAIKFDSKNG